MTVKTSRLTYIFRRPLQFFMLVGSIFYARRLTADETTRRRRRKKRTGHRKKRTGHREKTHRPP